MRQQIEQLLTALSTDETWLAWCRDNLGAMPHVAYEPDVPQEGIPDDQYPFVFLYRAAPTGPASCSLELAVGVLVEDGQTASDVSATLHGAAVTVPVVRCDGLLRAMDTLHQALDCVYRARLGDVDAQGETGAANLSPYFEAWATISAQWNKSTRTPLGRSPRR